MKKLLRAIYYDTETTGVKPGKDRVVEIAAYNPETQESFCSFVNPQMLIPKEASDITHITDEMVKEAPLFKEIIPKFIEFCSADAVLIAHNNEAFDKLFLQTEFERAGISMPEWKFLDTLKWSRKYRSDLPRHNLQTLREVYGIEANQAHRALDDVIVLHKVFSKMTDDLELSSIMDLLSQTSAIVRMPFGKHAGKPLSEVPKDYVRWLKETGAFDKKENGPLKDGFIALGFIS